MNLAKLKKMRLKDFYPGKDQSNYDIHKIGSKINV